MSWAILANIGCNQGVLLTVMFRSDVFRNTRARRINVKPTPHAVFDVVNRVVNENLAQDLWVLPTLEVVVNKWSCVGGDFE